MSRPTIVWVFEDEYQQWVARVPVRSHEDPAIQKGEYVIRIAPRPSYCDRGDWTLFVDGSGDSRLDGADGLPRYFFGTADEAKQQMEAWVSRREECNLKAPPTPDPKEEELVNKFMEIIRQEKRASTSLFQRRLRLSYLKAARIMDLLQERGIIGPGEGTQPRQILIKLD